MWSILKTLFVQGVLAKVLLRAFGWLAWLIPTGFILKFIGLPLLAVLSVLALPVLILLFIVGLPIFLVLVVGGALMALVGTVLTVGIALAKIIVPIALVVLLVRWLMRSKEPAPAASTEAPAAS